MLRGMQGQSSDPWRAIARRFLLLFLPFAVLFALALLMFFGYQSDILREQVLNNERHVAELARRTIHNEFRDAITDVLFLGQQNEIADLFAHDDANTRRRLGREFASFAKRRRRYDQIRILDLRGNELVRVNYLQGIPTVVPQWELQNKAKREYFIQARGLAPGQLYISPFDLNIEHGHVEEPRKPTIRIAMVLTDRHGIKRGLLIVNYLGQRLLDELHDLPENSYGGHIWLLNHQGYWLLGPSAHDEWSFMYPDRPPRRFELIYPKLWPRLLSSQQGQLQEKNQVFLYQRLNPLRGLLTRAGNTAAADSTPANAPAIVHSDDYPWFLVTAFNSNTLATKASLGRNLVWLYALLLALLLLAALIAWRLARTLLHSQQVEARAESNRALWQSFIDHSPSAVYIKDLDGHFMLVNPRCEAIMQRPAAEILGKTVHDFYPQEYADDNSDNDLTVATTGKQLETEEHTPIEGQLHTFMSVKFPVFDHQGRLYAIGAISTDITERKLAEDALRESESLFRSLLESAPDGIVILDPHGGIMLANDQALEIFQQAHTRLIGKPFSLFVPGFDSVEAPDLSDQNGVRRARLTGVRGNDKFPIEASLRPLYINKQMKALVIIVRDISERLRMEQQLRQRQKMEAIGQLSGGIAHDFNNLLGIIVGHLELATRLCQGDLSLQKRIDTALNAALRGAELTQRLLSFTRQQPINPETLHLHTVLEDMLDMLRRTLGADIRIETAFSPDLPPIQVDRHEFENAVLNLAINARDAMPSGGTITFATEHCEQDKLPSAAESTSNSSVFISASPDTLRQGHYVCLDVSDTGTGIPRHLMERVVEPFFTTKPGEQGTGLGLAMVYGFVRQAGGYLRLYSEEGVGTTLRLYFPATLAPPIPLRPAHGRGELPTGTERILVVDDEHELLDVAETYLHELGYQVLTASDAESALATLAETPDIDLLFSDIVMPGDMNGIELARQACRRHPGLKVLLTSGFPRQALENRDGHHIGHPLLRKPYRKEALAIEVRRVLDGAPLQGITDKL